MSASRLAIAAGLLTLALAPGSAPAARKERAIEPVAPPPLSISQIGAAFFIGQPRAAKTADKIVNIGSKVRIDRRLITRSNHPSEGDDQ